jgi:CBS domain-containing protein
LQDASKRRILTRPDKPSEALPVVRKHQEVYMTVARILAVKGRSVTTLQPHRTLAETAAVLAEKRIGAIVITGEGGDVLGIVSERDIIKALAAGGGAALQDPISKHMTEKVITATEDASVTSLMEDMTTGRFRHVPIVKNNRLAGLISIGDVVKYRLEDIDNERQALRHYIASA